MVTVAPEKVNLNCTICIQPYTNPRQLPGCSHCFCESCIVNFILDLKKKENLGSEFECPVCKLPSSSPGTDDSIHCWVTTLKVYKDINSNCEIKTGLPDNTQCCSQCLSREKVVKASKYCFTCQQYYCGSCSDTLHGFLVNKNHAVIDSEDERDTGKYEGDLSILNKFVTCSKHPKEVVTFFCEDEQKFCCFSCSVNFHKTCTHVKVISELSKEFNMGKHSTYLMGLSYRIFKHIDSVIQAVKEDNEDNKRRAEQLGVKFQEMKQKVISLLNMMESNLNDEGNAAVKNAAVKNQDEIDNLENLKEKLKTVPRLLEQVEKFTSIDQAFVCLLGIEHSIEGIEKQIIDKGGIVKTIGLELKTTDIFKTIQKLGPNETAQLVSVAQPEASICVPEYKDRPFLRKFSIRKCASRNLPKDINKSDTPTYNQLLFLPASNFVLVDSQFGCVCFVDKFFNVSARWVKFQTIGPCDLGNSFRFERHVTYLGNNLLAVSVPSRKTICLRSADPCYNLKGEIVCEYEPKAMCSLKTGEIAIAWNKPVAFGIISSRTWNCSGRVPISCLGIGGLGYCEKVYFTRDTSGRQLQSFEFMAVDEKRGHVVQPCTVEKAVFCFDINGKPVFQYSHKNLKEPKGVAADNDGNIYICESITNSIHVVSADGTGITIIDKRHGCPTKPLAIGYHKGNNQFAVTEDKDEKDRVTFFKVKRK